MPSRCVGRLLLLARLMLVTLWETFTVRLVLVQSTKILVGWDVFAKLSSDACWSVKTGLWWRDIFMQYTMTSIQQLCISLTKSREAPRDWPETGIGWFHKLLQITNSLLLGYLDSHDLACGFVDHLVDGAIRPTADLTKVSQILCSEVTVLLRGDLQLPRWLNTVCP